MTYHLIEDIDTNQDVYLSRLVVFRVSERKILYVLPILFKRDCAHGLVTSDLWYNEGIHIVAHVRGVRRRDEELCHCLLSVTVEYLLCRKFSYPE